MVLGDLDKKIGNYLAEESRFLTLFKFDFKYDTLAYWSVLLNLFSCNRELNKENYTLNENDQA